MSRITAKTSSTTKDKSEHFGGNNVETAPKSFGFCETQLSPIQEIVFLIK